MTTTTDTALHQAVEASKERYAAANPRSAERYRAATQVMPGGNTRTVLHYRPFPLAFGGAYHGGLLTFGDMPSAVNVPHRFVLSDYGDVERARAVIRANAAELGAIIVEPMLGAGGCVPASSEFLHLLRAEADACGAV